MLPILLSVRVVGLRNLLRRELWMVLRQSVAWDLISLDKFLGIGKLLRLFLLREVQDLMFLQIHGWMMTVSENLTEFWRDLCCRGRRLDLILLHSISQANEGGWTIASRPSMLGLGRILVRVAESIVIDIVTKEVIRLTFVSYLTWLVVIHRFLLLYFIGWDLTNNVGIRMLDTSNLSQVLTLCLCVLALNFVLSYFRSWLYIKFISKACHRRTHKRTYIGLSVTLSIAVESRTLHYFPWWSSKLSQFKSLLCLLELILQDSIVDSFDFLLLLLCVSQIMREDHLSFIHVWAMDALSTGSKCRFPIHSLYVLLTVDWIQQPLCIVLIYGLHIPLKELLKLSIWDLSWHVITTLKNHV